VRIIDLNHSPSRKRGLGASLRLAYHLYGKQLQKRLNVSDLSMAQYIHLRSLGEEGSLNQSELSALLGIEKASSTRVLDELEQRNLIRRERSREDRRVVIVSLSKHGRHTINQAMELARTVADRASKGLEEEELFQLFKAMDKLIKNLST
jgi:DNA-binding MarR family transcriptional regulator